jgi:hypothetical protein
MAYAEVTVYGQIPMGITSATNPTATKPAAYNTTVLNPPPVPNPPIGTNFTLVLQASNASVYPLSISLKGSFYGFSIEMSVISQLSESRPFHHNVSYIDTLPVGKNSEYILLIWIH